jgi:hypothetical protein
MKVAALLALIRTKPDIIRSILRSQGQCLVVDSTCSQWLRLYIEQNILKIKSLRERAQTSLGSLYDIRAFHDVVLGSGVPLNILERNVNTWIAQQKKMAK